MSNRKELTNNTIERRKKSTEGSTNVKSNTIHVKFISSLIILAAISTLSIINQRQRPVLFLSGKGTGRQTPLVLETATFAEFDSCKIKLLNREVGSVTRLVCQTTTTATSTIIKNKKDGDGNHNETVTVDIDVKKRVLPTTPGESNDINTPMPLHVKSWMKNEAFQGYSTLLYYSLNVTGNQSIHVLGMKPQREESDSEGEGDNITPHSSQTWERIDVKVNFSDHVCSNSLHSPSIIVDDEERKFYMHIRVGAHNGCTKNLTNTNSKNRYQPTLLFTSDDGLNWNFQMQNEQEKLYIFHELFYLSVPVYMEEDDYYYAIAKMKIQEDGVGAGGSAILCRSKSLSGPYEQGPVLCNGLRHVYLYMLPSSPAQNQEGEMVIYVFFTLYGDSSERLLLGTIDTAESTWELWKLLPGPRILQGNVYNFYENSAVSPPSDGGQADEAMYQLQDPYFLPDAVSKNGESQENRVISGTLFYTVQGGEQGIAVAKVVIDISIYHQKTIAYRNFKNISPVIYKSSSLRRSGGERKLNQTALITGVGRSGTTFMCTFFQKIGIKVSHDNNIDCGPYPGADGAVSWYDAFDYGRRYDQVLHIVRDPLKVMRSRMDRLLDGTLRLMVQEYEDADGSEFENEIFPLRHWVRRNSFVERHASWRVQTELFYSEPLSVWETCMAASFAGRCPTLINIGQVMEEMPNNLNTMRNKSSQSLSWKNLTLKVGPVNEKYIDIARVMARKYGYDEYENTTLVNYDCGFQIQKEGNYESWDCFLI